MTLETSEAPDVAEKAFILHTHLQAKHASIINSRYYETAKAVFEHRKQSGVVMTGELLVAEDLSDPELTTVISGYDHPEHPVAHFERWYNLIRERKQIRQDFLKSMSKAFIFETSPPTVTRVSFIAGEVLPLSINTLPTDTQLHSLTFYLPNSSPRICHCSNTKSRKRYYKSLKVLSRC